MRRVRASTVIAFAAAAIILADAVIVWIGLQADFAFDFTCCYHQAANRALDDPSTLYAWSDTYTFRYTPLGALLFAPLAPLSAEAAVWAWLAVKIAVLSITAWWFARPWTSRDRWLVVLLVVTFPPIVHDIVIGNVSTLTLLVLLAVARWQDGRGGIALGLLLVLMPKPHLLPVAAYLLVRRPRDFLAMLATTAVGVAAGLVIFGGGPWVAFLGTLREPLERGFTANVGFSALLGPLGVVLGVVIGGVALVAGVIVGGGRGYGMSIVGGILMGPYTFIHYLAGILVAVEPVLHTRPRWLAPFPWAIVFFPTIPIALAGLAAVIRASPPPPGEAAERPAAAPG